MAAYKGPGFRTGRTQAEKLSDARSFIPQTNYDPVCGHPVTTELPAGQATTNVNTPSADTAVPPSGHPGGAPFRLR